MGAGRSRREAAAAPPAGYRPPARRSRRSAARAACDRRRPSDSAPRSVRPAARRCPARPGRCAPARRRPVSGSPEARAGTGQLACRPRRSPGRPARLRRWRICSGSPPFRRCSAGRAAPAGPRSACLPRCVQHEVLLVPYEAEHLVEIDPLQRRDVVVVGCHHGPLGVEPAHGRQCAIVQTRRHPAVGPSPDDYRTQDGGATWGWSMLYCEVPLRTERMRLGTVIARGEVAAEEGRLFPDLSDAR